MADQRPNGYEQARPDRIFDFNGKIGKTFQKGPGLFFRHVPFANRESCDVDHFLQPQGWNNRAIGHAGKTAQQVFVNCVVSSGKPLPNSRMRSPTAHARSLSKAGAPMPGGR